MTVLGLVDFGTSEEGICAWLKDNLTAVRIKEFKTKIKVEFVRDHPIRAIMRMALRKAS